MPGHSQKSTISIAEPTSIPTSANPALAIFAFTLFGVWLLARPVVAQVPISLGAPTVEKLQEQIQNLKNPSYRTRQMAVWYLEQYPEQALPLLRAAGKTTDLNVGAEIVSMLSSQAMQADSKLSVDAHEALKEIAGGTQSVTAVSHLALDALEGIASRQELLAFRTLIELKVGIGEERLNINGAMQNEAGGRVILHITDEFEGKDEHLRMFRFLRWVDTAYLEGTTISEKMLREVLAMPSIKRLVLKGPAVSNAMLQTIFDVRELEHLELVYAPVDDEVIETLVDLPLVGSLRLFGTNISRDGAARIKKELDGLDIYIARGGFLGVSTIQSDLRVTKVLRGSGAEKAGILEDDIITHINKKPIKVFDQLRAELANFSAGEKVEVIVQRREFAEPKELTFEVTLGVQETQTN